MVLGSSIIIGMIIGYFALDIVFGFITKSINERKGYNGGFAWGFWLGIIGIIVVAVRQDNHAYSFSSQSSPMYGGALSSLNTQRTWTCVCGQKINEGTTICPYCRRSRYDQPKKIACPHCGAMNNETNTICFACGKNLREITPSLHEPSLDTVESSNYLDTEPQSPQLHQDIIDLISKLAALHDQGILTDAEFNTKKSELLSRI